MDDFLYIPSTPQPDEKRSKYNPFMRALRLDNLPPAVKPGHLTHILTHPPTGHGQAKRRQESGVSLVQVYTVPKRSRTKAPRGQRSRLPFRNARAHTKLEEEVHAASSSPRQSDELAEQARPLLSRALSPSTLHEESHRTARVSVSEVARPPEADEEGANVSADGATEEPRNTQTYAILRFRDEFWLFRAKDIFSRVTIDGRQIDIRTKRWNGSVIRRLWARTGEQVE